MLNKLNHTFTLKLGNGFIFLSDWCSVFSALKTLVLSSPKRLRFGKHLNLPGELPKGSV